MSKNNFMDNIILEKLRSSTDEIHKRLDVQCALIESILNREGDADNYQTSVDLKNNEREKKLISAIRDTIDVLEQTKKSFKSKRLELLRKKLTDVLIGE